MAVKRKMSRAKASAAILRAAASEFSAYGYSGAGIRSIAAEAGVASGLVCNYFGSKEKLLCEVVGEDRPEVIFEKTDAAEPYAVFSAYLDHIRFLQKNDPVRFRLHLRIAGKSGFPDSVYEVIRNGFEASRLKTAVLEAQRNGQLIQGDAFEVFKILSSSVYTLLNQYAELGAEPPENDAILNIVGCRKSAETEQSLSLREASAEAEEESLRNDMLYAVSKTEKWTYRIGADDTLSAAVFPDRAGSRLKNRFTDRAPDWTELLHPDDRERVLKEFMAAVNDRSGRTPYESTFRLRGSEGNELWFRSAGKVICHEDGSRDFIGLSMDITEQMEEQDRRRKLETRRREVLNEVLGEDAVFIIDSVRDTRRTLHDRLPGADRYPDGEAYSASFARYVDSFVSEPDRGILHRFVSLPYLSEFLGSKKSASVRYRDMSAGTQRFFEMKITRLSDTEFLQSFRRIDGEMLDRLMVGAWKENYFALFGVDLETGFVRSYKQDPLNIVGGEGNVVSLPFVMHTLASHFEGETKEVFERYADAAYIRKRFSGEDRASYIYRSSLEDGTMWAEATGTVLHRNEDGTPVLFCLAFSFLDQEAAELQTMRERLYAEAQRSSLFFDTFDAGKWVYQISRDDEILSAEYSDAVYRGTHTQATGKPMGWIELVHPEDREAILEKFMAAVHDRTGKTKYDVDFRVIGSDGKIRWTKAAGRVFRRRDGTGEFFGMNVDITDEVREQEEIRRIDDIVKTFAAEYEAVFLANISDGSYQTVTNIREISNIFNGEGSFTDALDRYTREMIYPPDRDRAISERIPAEKTGEGIAVGESHSVEFRSRVADGYAWYRGTMSRIGEDTVLVGLRDCSEEKDYHTIEEKIIGEFDALYMVTLERDEIRPVRASGIFGLGDFSGKQVYSQVCRAFADRVSPKYRQDWLRFSDPAYMKRYLAGQDRRESIYELPVTGTSSMRRFTVDVVERVNGEASRLLLSFTGIDDLRAQSILLERKMAEQNTLTRYFLEPYESAYYIGLQDMSWQVFKRTEKLAQSYPETGSYTVSLGKYIDSEVHPDDRATTSVLIDPAALKEKLAAHPSFSFTFRKITEPVERVLRCEVIRGADEDHAAFGFRDITEEVAADLKYQEELQNALETAQYANRAKTDFLFNMSHDIRTPMNAILGFTDRAIRNRNNPAVMDESLEKLKSSGEYMLQIVNDILDMARIESGRLEIREEIRYTESGKNALIDIMAAEADRKDIRFHASYRVKDKYIWIDHGHSSQIVANLLSNAIKYTNPGGDIWYTVQQLPCGREGYGRYAVSVRDTGIGMSPEFLGKIFDPFEREQSSTMSGAKGTGLGMAIVKRIVDAMGGKIEVRSEPGKGTEVVFTTEHRLASAEEIERYNSSLGETEKQRRASFEGLRVLLVEDNELNREIAVDILEDEGMTVETAENGSIAVELLRDKGPEHYDFILMDIQMPVMDGYEATAAIRKMYPDADIPIIAVSANAFEEDRVRSRAAGMNEHVPKPINVEELKAVLASFL